METEIQQLIEYHGVRVKYSRDNKITDMINWCYEQFGRPSSRWLVKGNYIYFKNEEDFTWYLLKWG